MLPAGGSAQLYVEDFLGTSRIVTQNNGVVCYDGDYTPFGGELPWTNTCPAQNNYKFEGKERDTETSNDDFGARSYSWRFGRWLSADWSAVPVPVPYANLTNPQTLNLYSMVADDPESFADLDGHQGPPTQQIDNSQPACAQAGFSCPKPPNPDAQANEAQDRAGGLIRDWLDVVEVSVSAGITAGVSGQAGVEEHKLEATPLAVEGHTGLGGGNADAGIVTGASAEGRAGPLQAGANVDGGLSIKEGPHASAEGNVGPIGGQVTVNHEGVTTSAGVGRTKDTKLGARVKLGVGIGVSLNLSQAGRATARTIQAVRAVVNFVSGWGAGLTPSFHPPGPPIN
jgi:RHS repeat-associated protein